MALLPAGVQDRKLGSSQVYFARGVDGLNRSSVIRSAVVIGHRLARFGITLVDPLNSDHALLRGDDLEAEEVVVNDLRVLGTCDAVLMDMTIPRRNYIGCNCELVYAFLWRKPVVVYVGRSGNHRRHWLRYHATVVCRTQGEAIAELVNILDKLEGVRV